MITLAQIQQATEEALIKASCGFRPDQKAAYQRAIVSEQEPGTRGMLEMMLENAHISEQNTLALCDDTGIPHVTLDIGEDADIEGSMGKLLPAVVAGIQDGLRALPGRPMAVKGDDLERLAQSAGLHNDSGLLEPAPIRIKSVQGNQVTVHVLMNGGGPEIRSKTFRIFHHHDANHVFDEIADWAIEVVELLGCTPCVPAIGIGRTHYEATNLMLDAMTYRDFGDETEAEKHITQKLNASFTGSLGVGGTVTALQTFIKVGPQRASGVRIATLRMGCSIDPRRGSVTLGPSIQAL